MNSVLRKLVLDWTVWLNANKMIDINDAFWERKAEKVKGIDSKHPRERVEEYLLPELESAVSEDEFDEVSEDMGEDE